MGNSHVSLLTYLGVAAFLVMLGYARAVWVRAKDDYQKTKAAVKPLRKAMWLSIWTTIKIGALCVLILGVIVVWNVRDIKDGGTSTPIVPAKIKPSATRAR